MDSEQSILATKGRFNSIQKANIINPDDTSHISILSRPNSIALLSQPVIKDIAKHYGQQLSGASSKLFNNAIVEYLPVSKLKCYFAVDTKYVTAKLKLIIYPFKHTEWSLKYQTDGSTPTAPRFELNSPDLYIPIMACITYILIASLTLGTQKRFTPEQIEHTATQAILIWLLELLTSGLIMYFMNITMNLQFLDLFAYSGYKFVGIIICTCLTLIGGRILYYIGMFYTNCAIGIFLIRSLKGPLLTDCNNHRKRVYYLFYVAISQPFWSWWLTSHLLLSR